MNKATEWLIYASGAELSILRRDECKTERGKYAGIGATVVFTGLFAFISGTYALWRVFHAQGWGLVVAVGIGLFWGLMIFNLDRFIVSSVRKTDEFGKQVLRAVPRFILAAFISVVVAAPLEVGLFSDRLTPEISAAEEKALEARRQRINYGIYGLDSLDAEIDAQRGLVAELDSLKNEDPDTERFGTLTARARACQQDLEALRARNGAQINRLVRQREEVQSGINEAVQARDDLNRTEAQRAEARQRVNRLVGPRRAINGEIGTLNRAIEAQAEVCAGIDGEVLAARTRYRAELDSIRAEAAALLNLTRSEQRQNQALADERIRRAEADLQTGYNENFITQVEALWRLDGGGVQVIKWLIVLLFLMVETAPIFVKLMSAKGPYDHWLDAEEEYARLVAQHYPQAALEQTRADFALRREAEAITHAEKLKQHEATMAQQTRQVQEHLAANAALHQEYTAKRKETQQRIFEHNLREYEAKQYNGQSHEKK